MSIVEKALKKLQEQKSSPVVGQASSAAPARTVFGQVVTVSPPSTPASPPLPPRRTLLIDQAALRAAHQLPPVDQEHQMGEQYRRIKRPLIASATGRGGPLLPSGHLIMMASAVPGEGKTFSAINLAMSMALEKDVRVLLVDADLAKPHISKLLGVSSEPGLLDVLRDDSLSIESVILPTDVSGLSVLPCGKQAGDATELLASDRMRTIVKSIGGHEQNRIVLFDSPPLLLTTEAQALAQAVGQIVLVVRAEMTPQEAVRNAIERLGHGKHVSLLLNQSKAAPSEGYYYGKS
jgi:exopolysaccharide/PEP-CTERM locus tyrosine autokinase